MNLAALGKNKGRHFWIPSAHAMPEMRPSVNKLTA
jgi:hypothetical protein